MAGRSYALARGNRYWLLAGIFFLALNWLGDSLDGTRPRVAAAAAAALRILPPTDIVDSFGGPALTEWAGVVRADASLHCRLGRPVAFLAVFHRNPTPGLTLPRRISAFVLELRSH